jgi:hypothetical protein
LLLSRVSQFLPTADSAHANWLMPTGTVRKNWGITRVLQDIQRGSCTGRVQVVYGSCTGAAEASSRSIDSSNCVSEIWLRLPDHPGGAGGCSSWRRLFWWTGNLPGMLWRVALWPVNCKAWLVSKIYLFQICFKNLFVSNLFQKFIFECPLPSVFWWLIMIKLSIN